MKSPRLQAWVFPNSEFRIPNSCDSTLLEKIARQPQEQSINLVGAEKAKQELEQNKSNISTLKKEISALKNQLVAKPESVDLIALVKDKEKFRAMEKGYKHLSFWYPSIQIGFQSLFLLPLILVGILVHNLARAKGIWTYLVD